MLIKTIVNVVSFCIMHLKTDDEDLGATLNRLRLMICRAFCFVTISYIK